MANRPMYVFYCAACDEVLGWGEKPVFGAYCTPCHAGKDPEKISLDEVLRVVKVDELPNAAALSEAHEVVQLSAIRKPPDDSDALPAWQEAHAAAVRAHSELISATKEALTLRDKERGRS